MKNTPDILLYLKNEIIRLEESIKFAELRLEGGYMVMSKNKLEHFKEIYNFINSY